MIPAHAMKEYRRSGCIAPLIPNPGTRQRDAVSLTPQLLYPWGGTPGITEEETGWARDPVWTVWRKFMSLPGFETRIAQSVV
jgi:hypothetical protein